jgi:hypothetical protein
MFELDKTFSEVKINPDFEKKVLKWLDNNQAYLEQIHNQVNNKFSTFFNIHTIIIILENNQTI